MQSHLHRNEFFKSATSREAGIQRTQRNEEFHEDENC